MEADFQDEDEQVVEEEEKEEVEEENDNNNEEVDIPLVKLPTITVQDIGNFRQKRIFIKTMEKLNEIEEKKIMIQNEDDLFEFIKDCNLLSEKIDEEIDKLHRNTVQLYSKRFPELDALVPFAQSYFKTMKRIGNHQTIGNNNGTSENSGGGLVLDDILPNAQAMVVVMAASITQGEPLKQEDYALCLKAYEEVFSLESSKQLLLKFIEGKMTLLAPNVCNLIGPTIAAMIIGYAGGLSQLANIPGSNIQVLGKQAVASRLSRGGGSLLGFGNNRSSLKHIGMIYYSPIVQSANADNRMQAFRFVSNKTAMLARIDVTRSEEMRFGKQGEIWKQELEEKIRQWNAPNANGKLKKPLPIPDAEPKKKRGGKRARKEKEKFALTKMGKALNRTKFGAGDDDEEYGDSAMGKSFGMLGKEGTGILRMQAGDQKLYDSNNNNNNQQKKKKLKGGREYKEISMESALLQSGVRLSSGTENGGLSIIPGSTTSFAYSSSTPVLEYTTNPANNNNNTNDNNKAKEGKYFGNQGFLKKI